MTHVNLPPPPPPPPLIIDVTTYATTDVLTNSSSVENALIVQGSLVDLTGVHADTYLYPIGVG